jgi:hypothetical protein
MFMTGARRNLIDKAAREAAMASFDAHGHAVPAPVAYGFIRTAVWVEDGDPELPQICPAEFGHDYARYCRLIQEGNPFVK